MRIEKMGLLLEYLPEERCIFKLWFDLCTLERKIKELGDKEGSKFLRYIQQIEDVSKSIDKKTIYEKAMILEFIEETRKYLIENNDFDGIGIVDEKKEYFEKRFFGKKRDDRKTKG